MTQVSNYNLPGPPASGSEVLTKINQMFAAVASSNGGATAPSSPVAGMLWYDTSGATPVVKVRNAANTNWVDLSAYMGLASAISALNVSGRNLIINGRGRVNQRAYVSGTATTGANQYTLDRWRVVTSGQNLSFTGNDSARTMTALAGGVEQVIEASNVLGGTYVLNWTGTATGRVNGTIRAKGEAFTLPANTAATVRFTSGTFTDVQLEQNVVTLYDNVGIDEELRRCQRYYETGEATHVLSSGGINYLYVPFKVAKRTAPTITRFGNGPITPGTSGTVPQFASTHGFYWYQAATTNAIGGDFIASAEL
jgi:hypothetical protein